MKLAALLLLSILPALIACRPADKPVWELPDEPGEEVNGIRIAWDYGSMQQLAERGGYPRLRRLQDNSIVAIFETYTGNVDLRRTYDEGVTWSEPERIFSQFLYENAAGASTLVNISNPEMIQLASGDIVAGCNYRPAAAEIAPYSIAIKRSTDNGATWLPPQILYDAAPRFGDGCWEPSFLQLPGGELQVYFANENPYRGSDEQEISVMSSHDNGATWEDARTVSFRAGKRDGMPVAAIVGEQIVVVIEDNGIGQFKPYTVRTSLAGNWPEPVLAGSPHREYALTEQISEGVYMGAPYILALPSGETLISYQTNQNRDANWELSTMEVAIGDSEARNFGKRTRPFDVPLTKEAKWNSLALWDENTVVALASSNARSEHIAPWLIKGYIVPEVSPGPKEITSYPIFIGSKGETNLLAGVGTDPSNLYVGCRVRDESLYVSSNGMAGSDGIFLYLYNGAESIRIWCDCKGDVAVYGRKNGEWHPGDAKGVQAASSPVAGGYELKISVPKEGTGMTSDRNIRLGIALAAYDPSQTGYTEMVASGIEDKPNSWLRIINR